MAALPPIGIDLGTTFSAAAVHRNGQTEVIPNLDGHRLTPSFVFFHENNSNVSVGSTADDLGIHAIKNFFFDIKRIIGRKYDDAYVERMRRSDEYHFNIVRGKDDDLEIEFQHDGVTVRKTPQQISAEILKYLKESATQYLGYEVTDAVISVPAYFGNAQRKATKAAAELAGLKVLKLISEPVAAAIDYRDAINKGNIVNVSKLKESRFVVFDFGGGTLDVSIIEATEKKFEVKGIEGDSYLGGRDIDSILFEHFKSEIRTESFSAKNKERLLRRLTKRCIKIKCKLSRESEFSVPFQSMNIDDIQMLKMNRETFEEKAKELFAKAIYLVEKCLKETGFDKEDISYVLLVGGSSRIPKIRDMLSVYFGKEKVRMNTNPDECVVQGAAIQAAVLVNQSEDLENFIITDVTPLSLGLCVGPGLMRVVINKNSSLPAQGNISVCTASNDQKCCAFPIIEGERKNCKYNNQLGSFDIDGLPPGKAGDIEFEVTFLLNEDGLLKVEARETSTGLRNKLTVTIGKFGHSDYQVKQKIEDAEQNKKDDDAFEEYANFVTSARLFVNHVLYDMKSNTNAIISE